MAAALKYEGKVLIINGTIQAIGKDITDTPYVELDRTVRCTFAERHAAELAALSKGQAVTLKGKFDGYFVWVTVKGCTLTVASAQ